jgi:hypothetical protein
MITACKSKRVPTDLAAQHGVPLFNQREGQQCSARAKESVALQLGRRVSVVGVIELTSARSDVAMEAEAEHDFSATADDELTFHKGQILKVIDAITHRASLLILLP